MRVRTLLVVALILVCTTVATATATAGDDARGTRASTAAVPVVAPITTPTTATAVSPVASIPSPLASAASSIAGDQPPPFEPSGGYARGPTAMQIGTDGDPGSEPTTATAATEPARTNLTIRLQPNGDAEWTVGVAVPLSGPNETQAFEALGDRYEAGRADAGPSIAPFERALTAASEGIEREMSLLDVSRSARIENRTGYLTLRFVWANFAEENAGWIRVGDAFRTPRGTWLPGLAANQTLVLAPPPGYGVNSAPIGPDNGTLRWEGPQEFEPGYLTVTYRRGLQATTATTTTPQAGSGGAFAPLVGAAALGIGLLVALYVRSRGFVLPGDDGDGSDATGGTDGTGPAGAEPDEDARSTGSASGSGTSPAAGIDEELLSDEERVERLLEVNGGRMRQATIVTETQWSNAKVSQLLSAMDREGRIDKLRIGRENLISLPDADVSDLENE